MKVGVIAFRQAQGQVDSYQIRDAGEQVIRDLTDALERHRRDTAQQIGDCIKQYFDPKSGLFTQRVRSLVGQGSEAGELERLIRSQVEGDGSLMARTLAAHVGDQSPLMRVLDPQSNGGLIALLTQATETTLAEQRERILREFSLDNGDSALARLVSELQRNHGDVGKALEDRIGSVIGEFSLDRHDSALSLLVGRVESAHRQISNEFSLDSEGSALARMKRELLDVIDGQQKANAEFQMEVLRSLTAMTARKEEAQRSTRHGLVFEDAVAGFVSARLAEGDVADRTGNTTGKIRNSKKGDMVIQLGPETAAPGARIVVEAKEDQSYTLQKALAEIAEARKNRSAGVGVFVFSQRTAPQDGLEPLARYGDDVVVVWDAEDPTTYAYLVAALSVARALSVQGAQGGGTLGVDVDGLEKAIREVERQAGGLDDITKSAQAIDSHVSKILDKARIVRNGLERQTGVLDEKVVALRTEA
ncbi:MAG: hypothetical protein F4X66_06765 [Chloroflexi bacterium]|nr:hypothetical protein [Chloroflexota bacterium]MYE41806.1 hypothetical protein [Chloroflexota bacterium]